MAKAAQKSLAAAMLKALLRQDIAAVRDCLERGFDVNVRLPNRVHCPDRQTSLMVAAEKGNAKLVSLLIARGADVNAQGEYGISALSYAVQNNKAAIVASLLKAGADPNLRHFNKEVVLLEAARHGDPRIVRLLLRHEADASAKSVLGIAPIHMAAFRGSVEVAKLLLRAGADINVRDRWRSGPLSCAIQENHREFVRFLLKAGADPKRQPEALGAAAWAGRYQIVRDLLVHGFDANSKAHQGRTPLQHARNRKHKRIVELLSS